MTGTRWIPILDMASDAYQVRIRDLYWGKIATLRHPDGSLADPLIFTSRDDAQRWLNTCHNAWDEGRVTPPPRHVGYCTACRQKTLRPITYDSGFSASGPGSPAHCYCPPCAIERMTANALLILWRDHMSICSRCQRYKNCDERTTLTDTFSAAAAFEIARARDHNLDR